MKTDKELIIMGLEKEQENLNRRAAVLINALKDLYRPLEAFNVLEELNVTKIKNDEIEARLCELNPERHLF